MTEFIAQGLLTCLLLMTIVWCAIVNARLSRLRGDQSEMRELILALNEATELAQKSIADMRRATLNAEQRAREQEAMVARRTRELRELMARSSQIAMKLDNTVNAAESRQKRVARPVEREAVAPATGRTKGNRAVSGKPRAQVQPARRSSDALARQQMLAALERVE